MIKWFKKLFHIVKHFDDIAASVDALGRDHIRVRRQVNDAVQTIKDRTTLHADVSHYRRDSHMNQIILIGRYRNRDYIQTYQVQPDDFEGLVRQCIEMQKYAYLSKIDAPYGMKEIIETESEKHWGIL